MRILIIRIKGIGNMVMFTPVLVNLHKELPEAEIVLFADKGSAEVVNGSNLINEIVYFDLSWSFFRKLKVILALRRRKFDYSIMTFPAHKWMFNLLAFMLGAKKRVTQGYSVDNVKALAFLQNERIPAVEGIHDVEQNMNLLKALGISSLKGDLRFFLSDDDKSFAESYFKEHKLKKVIALHVGGSDETAYKRWPIEYFTKVIPLLKEKEYDVLLVAGPGEENVVSEINLTLEGPVLVLNGLPLKRTAAIIARCSGLLCTDSGIGHIAAAVGIPVLSLVGPGDPRRISPYGRKCGFISGKTACSPCIHYPFGTSNSDYSKVVCSSLECLRKISPEEVRDKLLSLIG